MRRLPSPDRPRLQFFSWLPLLLFTTPLRESSAWAALWTTPCILLASIVITWGAESAQFFIAQGFALAMLAWMQTLPEFAVEGVLAWHQQTALLIANLTGALRLLTGLAWPLIYCTAAFVHRRRTGRPLRYIALDRAHSIEVFGLLVPLLYALVIWYKAYLDLVDAAVLVALYAAYLLVLSKLPPETHEGVQELETIPRSIVLARRPVRIAAIAGCFLSGGALIYFTAEPFLGSLIAVATALGIPSFFVIQWFAPIVSEFPELASTFYFARQEENAPVAIMNITSSNINQWTLLMAMLPVVFSMSKRVPSSFALSAQQDAELLLTIGQSLVAVVFLLNMEFAWWEALVMFSLFTAQFLLPAFWGNGVRVWITYIFIAWALLAFARIILRRRKPAALESFLETWRRYVVR
ncbi:MAG: hypothetical protein JO319_05045 [Acidobacteriaceae bacterium]|nr:hypothetical protein [Acidobacteriaceae bacterium]